MIKNGTLHLTLGQLYCGIDIFQFYRYCENYRDVRAEDIAQFTSEQNPARLTRRALDFLETNVHTSILAAGRKWIMGCSLAHFFLSNRDNFLSQGQDDVVDVSDIMDDLAWMGSLDGELLGRLDSFFEQLASGAITIEVVLGSTSMPQNTSRPLASVGGD